VKTVLTHRLTRSVIKQAARGLKNNTLYLRREIFRNQFSIPLLTWRYQIFVNRESKAYSQQVPSADYATPHGFAHAAIVVWSAETETRDKAQVTH